MSLIRSPQHPEDIQPVPWPQRQLSEIGLPGTAIAELGTRGIRTLGDLPPVTTDIWFSGLPGVGAKTAPKCLAALAAFKETAL